MLDLVRSERRGCERGKVCVFYYCRTYYKKEDVCVYYCST